MTLQGADPVRIAAYRRAALIIATLACPVAKIFAERGRDGLIGIRGISRSMAAALGEMVSAGYWSQLARLRGAAEPEKLLRTIPHIGAELARRLAEELHIETLEALEMAVHDGRLGNIEGVGLRRVERIALALSARLGSSRPRDLKNRQERPGVELLLEIDREYRERAAAGTLPMLAAKPADASGEAKLPILHMSCGKWDFTALYSNTRLAHELGRAKDWIVIHYEADKQPESQCLVIKETRGPSLGLRVVRGRETECMELWMRTHFAEQARPAVAKPKSEPARPEGLEASVA